MATVEARHAREVEVETSPGGKEAEPGAHILRVRAEVSPDQEADPPKAKAKTEVEAPQKAKEKAKRTLTKLVVSS